ncbi:MAG: hypothetical protein ABI372_03330 [Ginsengibacter sp.]
MKTKITMLIALILMTTTGIYAQGMQRRTVPERVKTTMDKISTPLTLDASQASRTDSVFADFYTAQAKIFKDAKASGSLPDRNDYEKLMQERDIKLKAIFTADQYTKFKNEVEDLLRPQFQRHEGN